MSSEQLLSVELPFSGFYESLHSARFDEWFEHRSEYLREECKLSEEDIDEISNAYVDGTNWKGVYVAYAKKYTELLCAEFDLSLEFEELYSPRYYNYETDRIYAKMPLPTIERILAGTPKDFWKLFVEANCTSYDGFISHYPANADDWPKDIATWGEAGLGLLLRAHMVHTFVSRDTSLDYKKAAKKLRDFLDCELMEDQFGNGFIDDLLFDPEINPPEQYRFAAKYNAMSEPVKQLTLF